MNRVKLKIGNIEASASGDSYVSGALTFGIGFGGLGLAGWGLVNLLKGAGNAIVNIGATVLGAIATGWALNHAEKKEEQHETKKTEKLEESKVESKDVESVSNSVENDSCNIEESSLEDVVYSVPSADFKPLVRDLITAGGIYGNIKEVQEKAFLIEISKDVKPKYHAAASILSNHVVAVLNAGYHLLTECGFSDIEARQFSKMLVTNNLEHVIDTGCVSALTGPIERGDAETVKKHLEVMDKETKDLYRVCGLELVRIAKTKNPDRNYIEIEKILDKERI